MSRLPMTPDADPFDITLQDAISAYLDAPGALPSTRQKALKSRIDGLIGFGSEHRLLPARGGDWRVLGTGVFLKVLERDAATRWSTYLVRYLPGAGFPRHPQRSIEECLLVSGDLQIGDQHMQAGDLQIAVPGIDHGPLHSRHGALVFVRGVLNQIPETRADGVELD